MAVKLAITGKGGVGKTTTCALLARAYVGAGRRVLAVDADPNATLASGLGFATPEAITPLSEMADLIEERTGVKPGTQGAMFRLNPRVDDIPARFSVEHEGIRILRMGGVKSGGAGCYCPESTFLRSLVSQLLLDEQDVLILDMEAGIEHLSRGTARGVDWLVIVTEPSRQGLATAARIRQLAADVGITRVGCIGNKIRGEEERELIRNGVAPVPLLGALPYDDGLRRAEIEGRPPVASAREVQQEIEAILARLG